MSRKIGPNDPCRCGSGKKYKKCCGAGVIARTVGAFAGGMTAGLAHAQSRSTSNNDASRRALSESVSSFLKKFPNGGDTFVFAVHALLKAEDIESFLDKESLDTWGASREFPQRISTGAAQFERLMKDGKYMADVSAAYDLASGGLMIRASAAYKRTS